MSTRQSHFVDFLGYWNGTLILTTPSLSNNIPIRSASMGAIGDHLLHDRPWNIVSGLEASRVNFKHVETNYWCAGGLHSWMGFL
jgi:hypothetical protein